MLYNSKGKYRYGWAKYLFMFAIIFLSDSAFVNYSLEGYYAKIVFSLTLGTFGIYFLLVKSRKVSSFFFFSVLIMLASAFINSSPTGVFVAYISILVFAYYFTKIYDVNEFLSIYLNLMRVLVLISLAVYFLLVLFPSARNACPVTTYSYNLTEPVKYYELIVTHMPLTSWGIERNYGVFWEPGVFQIYINLALLISLFYKKVRLLVFDTIVFSIAIITTFSTTGYITILLVFICFLLNKKVSISRRFAISGIAIIIFCYILVGLSGEMEDYVFYKFVAQEDNSSYVSRMYSILGNVNVALRNPIFGVGYSNSDEALIEYIGRFSAAELHQTNTILNYFATFGLFVGAYVTRLWWKTSRMLGRNSKLAVFIFATLFVMLSGENMIASFFFTILMFYGINTHKQLNLNERQ